MTDYARRSDGAEQSIAVAITGFDGAPVIDLTAALVNAFYYRLRDVLTPVPLLDIGVTDDHAPGGFVAVNAFAPGLYRLDLPDAALASGVPDVVVLLSGVNFVRTYVVALQPIDANLVTINGVFINGAGVEGDSFQP